MKKRLLHLDLYSERLIPEVMDANTKRLQLFQKYFPKYLKRLCYISRDGQVASKVKRVKVIQDFETSHILSAEQDWRILLGNKIKSVRAICNFNNTPLQFSEKIKCLSRLNTITISMPNYGFFDPVEDREHFLERACRPMRRLKNLKYLDISQLTSDCQPFLMKLDSFPKVLCSLKKLGISFQKKAANNLKFLDILPQNQNILKYMTHLNLGVLCSNQHFQSFALFGNACPNLLTLTFEFSCRNIKYNLYGLKYVPRECFEVSTNYLQAIGTFQKLRVLNLDIADSFTLLKDFALPPSVQYLRLNFEECLSKEILNKLDLNFSNLSDLQVSQFFRENTTLSSFYKNFQQLEHLESLELVENLRSNTESHQHQTYLIQNFMKKISSVKKFSWKFSAGFAGLIQANCNMRDNGNLTSFFEACHHLGKSLEILEIGHEEIMLPPVGLCAFHGKFTNLSSVAIKGTFHESDGVNDKMGTLLKEISSLGENIKTVKVYTIVMSLVEPLLTLLRQLNQLKNPHKAKIELQIKFLGNQDLEELRGGLIVLNDDMKTGQGFLKARGISLKLFTDISSEDIREFLKRYGEKYESFEILPSFYNFQ